MKQKFNFTEAFVIVTNYGEGDSIDDTVYIDLDEAEKVSAKYNVGNDYQWASSVINISDFQSAQYDRGSSNAMYD